MRFEDTTLLASKIEEGAASQGKQAPLEAGKGTETDSPLEPPEGTQPSWSILDGWHTELKHTIFDLMPFLAAAIGNE